MGFLRRFLYGRYGGDNLGRALMAAYLATYLIGLLARWGALCILSLLPAGWCLFRMLSRNLPARRRENDRYLALTAAPRRFLRRRRAIHGVKTHRYFKCPNCGQQLRVPRVSGTLKITCRACGAVFEEKIK